MEILNFLHCPTKSLLLMIESNLNASIRNSNVKEIYHSSILNSILMLKSSQARKKVIAFDNSV